MKREVLYGGLPPLANIGESNIKTSEAYQEAKPSKVNHAEKVQQEVSKLPRWNGGRVMRTKGGGK